MKNRVGEFHIKVHHEAPGSTPHAWWTEGGRVSRFANRLPGVNATAGLHDMMQRQLQISFGSVVEATLLVPTMLPAAAITYGGLMANPSAMMIYFNEQ